uniref:Uncharacterized protein n=1 Tax=Arundo donax TaxID=35708 RepID=A0A0A9BKH3_ARUDO
MLIPNNHWGVRLVGWIIDS